MKQASLAINENEITKQILEHFKGWNCFVGEKFDSWIKLWFNL